MLTDDQYRALNRGTGRVTGKYGAARNTPCGFGHLHDSKKEADYCRTLNFRQRGGEISELVNQPSFNLVVNGQLVCRYVGDFQYYDRAAKKTRVVDVKSEATKTPLFRLKVKLVKACLGIEVETV